MQSFEAFFPLLRQHVDFKVEHAHDEDRQKESSDGGDQNQYHSTHAGRVHEGNVALVHPLVFHDSGPQHYPRRPQQDGNDPSKRNHDACFGRSPVHSVRQWSGDGEVTVEADDEQIGYGGVAHGVVDREPHVAQKHRQRPKFIEEDVHGVERQ